MAEHGYELEHIKTAYPEIQAESLEITIIPGLEWAMSKFNRPVMIDDSGLFIGVLGGFPGVYSSYVFKTLGNDGILDLMEGKEPRSARFECCIGFKAPGKDPFIAKGIAKGSIATKKSGTGGFGYDPIFIPDGDSRTYAEIAVSEKNRISHRGKAIGILLKELPRLLERGV
jgi:XTP/dITP diphosphohydrolase